jgi:O-glycosyl hydrolase
MRKVFSLIALIVLYAIAAQAQLYSGVISTARAGNNWPNAGIPGGLPDSAWTQCGSTIAAYSGTAATITNQLATCAQNTYVLLGAGTFTLSSAIQFPLNTTGHLEVRGSGAASTFLNFTGDTLCPNGTTGLICISSSDGTYPGGTTTNTTWTAGYAQGATQLTLGSVASITAGKTWLILNQCDIGFSGSACTTGQATDNGGYFPCSAAYTSAGPPIIGCSASGPDGVTYRSNAWQMEIVLVTAINSGGCGATCVTINQGLEHPNWASGQSPQAVIVQPVFQDGVENLSMDGTSAGSGLGEAIGFQNCYQCFVSGLRIANMYSFGIYGLEVSHTLIQNNYIYRSINEPDSYAIRLSWAGDDLTQNNIIQQWKNTFANDGPASGEVLGYNFSVDQIVNDPSDQMWGAWWTHSAGDDFMLREGNEGNQAQDDNVHGSHLNPTLFRNFLWGWESCRNSTTGAGNCGAQTVKDETSVAIVQSSNVRYANDIGNVLGTPGATTTYITTVPFAGYAVYNLGGGTTTNSRPADPLSLFGTTATNMGWANWDSVTGTVRFCGNSSDTGWVTTCASTSEIPTSAPTYPNTVPTLGDTGAGQSPLPASLYLSSEPAWFGSFTWPPVGPDVTGGNVNQCTGTFNTTNQAGLPATSTSQCGSGAYTNAWAGHVNANPAMACFFSMGGTPDGTGPELTFNPNVCYPTTSLPTVSVNYASVNQTMQGWGASTGFNERNTNLTGAQADCFFSYPSAGSCSTGNIGLEWIKIQDNHTANTAPDLPTLQLAVARGVQVLLGFNGPQLNSGSYASEAAYMVAKIQYFQANGVPIAMMSPINEPVNTGTTGAELDTFIASYLHPALSAAGLATPIELGDGVEWFTTDYVTPCMDDGACSPYVPNVGGHDYGTGSVNGFGLVGIENCCTTYVPPPSSAAGKGVWMTEVTGGFTGPCASDSGEPTFDSSMADALVWASNLHYFVVAAGGQAWFYWNLAAETNHGPPDCNDGLTASSYAPTKRFFVTGNWSQFVRTGYSNIAATANPVSGIYATAFKGTAGQLVIVAVNQNSSMTALNFSLSGVTISSVVPYVTSSNFNLAAQTAVSVSGNAFTYTLPAQSVTTFVGQATGTISCTSGPLTYGNQSVGTQSSAQTITCTNTGTTAIAMNLPVTVSPTSDYVFTTSSNPCPATLAIGASCMTNVAFKPSAVGTRTATVSISDSAVGSPQTVALMGTGISSGAGTLVQHTSVGAGTQTTYTLPFASNVTSGNFISVVVSSTSATEVYTVTDSLGNTYHQAVQQSQSTGGTTAAIYYAMNISGGADNVTVAQSVSAHLNFAILEYSGIATTSALDVTASNTGTGTAVSSGSATTTANGDLLIGGLMASGAGFTFTAGTGYTIEEAVSAAPSTFLVAEDQVQTSAGSASATATVSASNPWAATFAAFKNSIPGGPAISSLSAISGNIGATFNIVGTGFGSTQSTSTATLNGSNLTVNTWSATSINVTVPSGGLTGSVVVTVGGVASNSLTFTVTPFLSGVATSPNPVGTTVTISGTGFTATQGSSTVAFNGSTCTPSAWSSTSITCVVPSSATTGNVTATVGGNTSNGIAFTVSPAITSLSTSSGQVGSSVVISGTTFGASQGASVVSFNGTAATCSVWSPPSLACTVPVGATTGPVTVTVGGVTSNSESFTVTSLPIISSVSPNAGVISSSTTISGSHFGATQGSSTVTFNGTAALCGSWSNTSLTCTVPSGATTGNVVVTTSVGASNGVPFTVTAPSLPAITSLSPIAGPVSSSVVIAGSNFGPSQGSSTVTFNSVAATCGTWGASSITCTVPSTTTGPVIVTTSSGASNSVTFTVQATVIVTSLTPNAGLVGTAVTIAGSGFGSSQDGSTVKFGGVTATCSAWTSTSLTCTVPSGAVTGNVVVTVSSVASNGVNFTVTPSGTSPIIASVSPTAGLNGVLITITGSNFGATQGASSVSFGGIFCTPTHWSATNIQCPAPAGMPLGPNSLVVTVGGLPSNSVNFQVLTTQIIIFGGSLSNVVVQ